MVCHLRRSQWSLGVRVALGTEEAPGVYQQSGFRAL